MTTVDTPWGVVGVGICYDIRFPELALVMRQRGAKILIYPGAFNMTTVIVFLQHNLIMSYGMFFSRARLIGNYCKDRVQLTIRLEVNNFLSYLQCQPYALSYTHDPIICMLCNHFIILVE